MPSGEVRLRIEETEHLWKVERSPDDGAEVACYDHTEEMVWRHLNVFEHKCEIRCRLPRARCSKTQKIVRVRATASTADFRQEAVLRTCSMHSPRGATAAPLKFANF